ncbi:thioredoxin family protein [Desulfobacula phenolica]|uniref:Thioredoxin 1 n=1 Tax=Desulfobacula phenolica TaxID=90732 RepID=A0A1H2IRB3_9BACT|nr:thioredoxin family protein [Desulfobacula phenolica]SDU46684.1 thioredoxin 1 [Desulfobacula phenolica]
MIQIPKQLSLLCIILILCFTFHTGVFAEDFSNVPAKGKVTMIDLGAKTCIPCKMMAPILVKLEKAYKGKADIVFIDIRKNRQQASRFKIRAIPTQIFFNEQGEEVYRHVGFLNEKSIIEQMAQMGIEKPDPASKG